MICNGIYMNKKDRVLTLTLLLFSYLVKKVTLHLALAIFRCPFQYHRQKTQGNECLVLYINWT